VVRQREGAIKQNCSAKIRSVGVGICTFTAVKFAGYSGHVSLQIFADFYTPCSQKRIARGQFARHVGNDVCAKRVGVSASYLWFEILFATMIFRPYYISVQIFTPPPRHQTWVRIHRSKDRNLWSVVSPKTTFLSWSSLAWIKWSRWINSAIWLVRQDVHSYSSMTKK
jgi:hypothetical protein